MTDRLCSVPHCNSPVSSGYSAHCRRHKSVLRRHGSPKQRGVTKTELTHYMARIEARIVKNPNSEAWPLLERSWVEIVAEARTTAARRIANRYERSAANEILAIDQGAQATEVIKTVLAIVCFWHDVPLRFCSDDALRVQIARRVRALSQCHIGLKYDHQTGNQIRVYCELPPKAAVIIGQTLMMVFGGIGLQLAALEERDRKAAQETKQRLVTAINSLS